MMATELNQMKGNNKWKQMKGESTEWRFKDCFNVKENETGAQ